MRIALATAAVLVAVVAAFAIQARRANLSIGELIAGPARFNLARELDAGRTIARGPRIDFLSPQPVGPPVGPDDRPLVANVAIADLDRDGLADILVADAAVNRITWLRQSPAGRFTEQALAEIAGPAHVSAVDLDGDKDLDIAVASLGVLFPNDARIGSVIILENDGRQSFTSRVLVDQVARVSDVRAGDLDGDGDLDLAVAQFGYNQGETRWLENQGGWRFASHMLQHLSGPINAEIADIDGDRDLDIVSLVSQEWEEIYVFVNDGRGRFTPDYRDRSRSRPRCRRAVQQRRRLRLRATEGARVERRAVAREHGRRLVPLPPYRGLRRRLEPAGRRPRR
jgi:hypothetical protein